MLILLAALLLSGPSSARAEDSPAAAAPAVDPADQDGDGTVSGKERRQKRRADRRARRGDKGPNGEILSDEEADAAEEAEASARSSAAGGKAANAAAALKSSLPSADAAGSLPGEAEPGAEKPGEGGRKSDGITSAAAGRLPTVPVGDAAKATGDPGRPKSLSDFALAARSGYAPAFAAAGLKLGSDGKTIVRLDGKPATAADYARLQREIGSMPAALGRRPDFFSAVSPEHYADLKRGYKEKKDGGAVYKDVGTTEGDRDFVHTASCSKLSGECNKSVEKASYKKGDFVAPEDLDSMWDALQKELDGSAESGGLPSLSSARTDIARESAIEAAVALSGGGGKSDVVTSAPAGGSAAVAADPVASVRRLWTSAASLAFPGADGAETGGSGPSLALGLIALGAFGAGALFLRRKG